MFSCVGSSSCRVAKLVDMADGMTLSLSPPPTYLQSTFSEYDVINSSSDRCHTCLTENMSMRPPSYPTLFKTSLTNSCSTHIPYLTPSSSLLAPVSAPAFVSALVPSPTSAAPASGLVPPVYATDALVPGPLPVLAHLVPAFLSPVPAPVPVLPRGCYARRGNRRFVAVPSSHRAMDQSAPRTRLQARSHIRMRVNHYGVWNAYNSGSEEW
jgi:hypothetical protein